MVSIKGNKKLKLDLKSLSLQYSLLSLICLFCCCMTEFSLFYLLLKSLRVGEKQDRIHNKPLGHMTYTKYLGILLLHMIQFIQ